MLIGLFSRDSRLGGEREPLVKDEVKVGSPDALVLRVALALL